MARYSKTEQKMCGKEPLEKNQSCYLKIEKARHHGVDFDLKLIKGDEKPFNPDDRVPSQWWVLENDDTQKNFKEIIEILEKRRFAENSLLYEDSLHYHNDGMTLEQRHQSMFDQAKADIDDKILKAPKILEEQFSELSKGFKEDIAKARRLLKG